MKYYVCYQKHLTPLLQNYLNIYQIEEISRPITHNWIVLNDDQFKRLKILLAKNSYNLDEFSKNQYEIIWTFNSYPYY